MSQFNETAKEWDTPRNRERAADVGNLIRSAAPVSAETSAFGYGTGTRLLSFELHDDIGSATLAANSEDMLKVLNDKISSHSIENMRASSLNLLEDPLPSDQFNLIYTMLPLHHTRGVRQLLGKFYELLGDGGFLCLADLELDEDDSFPGYDADLVHEIFDHNDLASITKNAGFKDISFIAGCKMEHKIHEGSAQLFLIFLIF